MTPKEILALWDHAVAMHRAYWWAVDCGQLTEAMRDADSKAVVQFKMATDLAGPDGVAAGY